MDVRKEYLKLVIGLSACGESDVNLVGKWKNGHNTGRRVGAFVGLCSFSIL